MKTITHQSLLDAGSCPATGTQSLSPEILKSLYRSMVRLRRFEERLMKEYRVAEEMKCPIHFVIGQEAVSSALSLLIKREDHLFSHHRSHGYYIAKGAPLRDLVAELFGRATGANGGLAGSQEISHPAFNFHSGAILTGASSIATGVALASQLDQKQTIAFAGFGEAATEEGVFWEAINFAAARKLPLIYICENNLYSMFSLQNERQALDNIHERVASFGMKSEVCFGNDAPLAYRTLERAIDRAKKGEGPTFIEFYTYRLNAHVGPESDDYLGYRKPGAAEFWQKHCSLNALKEVLVKEAIWCDQWNETLLKEIDLEIQEAIDFARGSDWPIPDSYRQKNYCSETPEADRLLQEAPREAFDSYQKDAILAPY